VTPPRSPSAEDITRTHGPSCDCADDVCVGRAIQRDVTALVLVPVPGLARCDGYAAEAALVALAARKGGAPT